MAHCPESVEVLSAFLHRVIPHRKGGPQCAQCGRPGAYTLVQMTQDDASSQWETEQAVCINAKCGTSRLRADPSPPRT